MLMSFSAAVRRVTFTQASQNGMVWTAGLISGGRRLRQSRRRTARFAR